VAGDSEGGQLPPRTVRSTSSRCACVVAAATVVLLVSACTSDEPAVDLGSCRLIEANSTELQGLSRSFFDSGEWIAMAGFDVTDSSASDRPDYTVIGEVHQISGSRIGDVAIHTFVADDIAAAIQRDAEVWIQAEAGRGHERYVERALALTDGRAFVLGDCGVELNLSVSELASRASGDQDVADVVRGWLQDTGSNAVGESLEAPTPSAPPKGSD
jgi:hypothetical protein